MPRTTTSVNKNAPLLEAALEGLELQKARIEEQIREVQSLLGRRGAARRTAPKEPEAAAPAATRKRRRLSPAARKRIAAAQKRRWAEYRKSLAPAPKAAGRKVAKQAAKQE
jgi:hypothetical protein